MSLRSKLVVHSESYNDKGVVDSVMELFEGMLPPGSTGPRKMQQKIEEHVLWASFEDCDLNDIHFNYELVNIRHTQQEDYVPLVLLVGTTAGLQIWVIDPKGEAQLLMTYYDAVIRHAKLLPAPEIKDGAVDAYASRRPILIVNSTPHGAATTRSKSLGFISLRNKEDIRPTILDREIRGIWGNKRFLVVCMNGKLVVYNNHDLKERITIINVLGLGDVDSCPVALGSRWLAFGDRKHEPINQSLGGISSDAMTSYTGKIISVMDACTNVVMQGLNYIGESAVNSWSGASGEPVGADAGANSSRRFAGKKASVSGETTPSNGSPGEESGPGFVSVVDLFKLTSLAHSEPVNVHHTDSDGLVAHFSAHTSAPVASLCFDGCGQLLLSACRLGRDFHVYRLLPHPKYPQQTAVHHLYALHRGDTVSQVADIAFAPDSRWVAISTRHGTTHVFPLTPYGGAITARTHGQSRVVNRTSRFLQSAGVDERTTVAQSGRESPAARVQGGPITTGPTTGPDPLLMKTSHLNASNPRLPPFPMVTQLQPFLQIKQAFASITKWRTAISQWQQTSNASNPSANHECVLPLPLVACFAHSRARIAGQTANTSYAREREREAKPPLDALFLVNCEGRLVELMLDVRPRRPVSGSGPPTVHSQQWNGYPKDGPVELVHTPRAQWVLSRGRAVAVATASNNGRGVNVPAPPLLSTHPLVTAAEATQPRRNCSFGPNASPNTSALSCDIGGDSFRRTNSQDSLPQRPPSVDSLPSSEASESESWLAHVEIVTHVGPPRRLWMGPQFNFKTYQSSPLVGTSASSVVLTSAESSTQPLLSSSFNSDDADYDSGPSSLGVPGTHVSSHPLPAARSSLRARNVSGSPKACVYIEAGSFNDSFGTGTGLEGLDYLDEDAIREGIAEAMQEPRTDRRSTPSRDFIQESDFQVESWSSGSDCLAPETGRFGPRMQFP